MKKLFQLAMYCLFWIFLGLVSCQKDKLENSTSEEGINPGGNLSPFAKAGPDEIVVLPKDSVLLNGSESKDPDGTISSYQWAKVSGPASFLIVDPASSITMVKNLEAGTYAFELTVRDDKGAVSKDEVVIIVISRIDHGFCDISSYPEINITLTPIGNLSVPQAPYVTACGSKIIFAGGDNEYAGVDIYDVNTHAWEKGTLSAARTNMAIISCGNKIFFAGGNNNDIWYDIIDIYDVSNGSWAVKHLNEPKSVLTAASIGDKVFFAGGITEEGWNQTGIVEIYDTQKDEWTTASLSEPKIGLSAVTAGNKIYFAGGWNYLSGINNPIIPLKSVDIYDASSGAWSASSLSVIEGGVSGVTFDNKIYWGGINGSKYNGKMEIWDLQSGMITSSCLSYARRYPTAVEKDGNIIFFTTGSCGSSIGYEEISDRFDIYNVETGITSIAWLSQSLAGAAIIKVNNTIYVAGGRSTTGYKSDVYIMSW